MTAQTPDQLYTKAVEIRDGSRIIKGVERGEFLVRGSKANVMYTVVASGQFITGNTVDPLIATCTCVHFKIRCEADNLFCKHIAAVCIQQGYSKGTITTRFEKPDVQYIISAYAQHASDGSTYVGFSKTLARNGTFNVDIDVNDINAYFKGMRIKGNPNGKVTVTLMSPSKDDVVMEYDLTKI